MGELTCYIHKDRTAVHKCDTCRKYICLECKTYSDDSTDSSDYYICPLCRANEIEAKEENSLVGIVACVGFVIVVGVIIGLASSSFNDSAIPNPSIIGFLVFFIIMVIVIIGFVAFVSGNKQKKPNPQAEALRANVKKAMEESSAKLKKEQETHIALYCSFCGAPIPEFANTCEYCGMKWKWKA